MLHIIMFFLSIYKTAEAAVWMRFALFKNFFTVAAVVYKHVFFLSIYKTAEAAVWMRLPYSKNICLKCLASRDDPQL